MLFRLTIHAYIQRFGVLFIQLYENVFLGNTDIVLYSSKLFENLESPLTRVLANQDSK